MKIIFVSGPYTAEKHSEISDNIIRAEFVSLQLLSKGWAVFTPHKNMSFYEKYESVYGFSYSFWLDVSLEFLSKSDAIYMMKDWTKSNGATIEHEKARQLGIKIFYESDGIPKPEDIL